MVVAGRFGGIGGGGLTGVGDDPAAFLDRGEVFGRGGGVDWFLCVGC